MRQGTDPGPSNSTRAICIGASFKFTEVDESPVPVIVLGRVSSFV